MRSATPERPAQEAACCCGMARRHIIPLVAQNLAVALQNRMSEVLHVDIHPGAQIGRGVLIDHATGVVRVWIAL